MPDRRNANLLTAALAGFCLSLTACPAWSDDNQATDHRTIHRTDHPGEHREDHDQARDLVNRGNIRPLPEVLRAVQAYVSGEIIDVRLRSKDLRWIYVCKLVTPAGRRVVVAIDAATLAIVEGERQE